jgi:hypothetical protein
LLYFSPMVDFNGLVEQNSLYFPSQQGIPASETSSLKTASSSAESATNRAAAGQAPVGAAGPPTL